MKNQNYQSFLESELDSVSPKDALFHIVPVPYEKSVSYGKGTLNGPAAILNASQQLELFDGISIPAQEGIYTQEPFFCACSSEELFDRIGENISTILKDGKIPIMLGGEHSITAGALLGISRRYKDFGVVHFDAHADLRDTYENNRHSHACVMHRALDMEVPIFQVGVRSLSYEEEQLRKAKSIGHLDAAQIAAKGIPEGILPVDFPKDIYLSIDVDVFDPAIIPATGTPEPGGLDWYQMMKIFSILLQDRLVIGFDVVELAPIKGMHASDYTIARLIYNLIGMVARSRTD